MKFSDQERFWIFLAVLCAFAFTFWIFCETAQIEEECASRGGIHLPHGGCIKKECFAK